MREQGGCTLRKETDLKRNRNSIAEIPIPLYIWILS